MRLVIIGNGPAGVELAKRVSNHYEVTIIDEAELPFYFKPMLSNYIAGFSRKEDLFQYDFTWYEKNDIRLLAGMKVNKIDLSAKKVFTADVEYSFDILVLATGARPRELAVEGSELLLMLRTFHDAENIKKQLEASDEVVIVGTGFIGLEVAGNLSKAGYKIKMIGKSENFLGLDQELSNIIKKHLEQDGVEFHLTANIEKIDKMGILTDKGYVKGQVKICAIGVIPNKELAKASGINVERGVLIDERFRTSVQDVYAIGDCSEFQGILCGTAKTASEHAKVLADILRGNENSFDFGFRSSIFKFGDFPISIIGRTTQEGKWIDGNTKVFHQQSKIVGAVVLQDIRKAAEMEQRIKEQHSNSNGK